MLPPKAMQAIAPRSQRTRLSKAIIEGMIHPARRARLDPIHTPSPALRGSMVIAAAAKAIQRGASISCLTSNAKMIAPSDRVGSRMVTGRTGQTSSTAAIVKAPPIKTARVDPINCAASQAPRYAAAQVATAVVKIAATISMADPESVSCSAVNRPWPRPPIVAAKLVSSTMIAKSIFLAMHHLGRGIKPSFEPREISISK